MTTTTLDRPNVFTGSLAWLTASRKRWIAALLLLLLAAAGAAVYEVRSRTAPSYVTVPVTRATLVQSVTASGIVNPQNNISVGTQVSGTISEIDVDFNSKVKKGQVLARLDPSTFQAQLAQAQAALAQAQAQTAQASATAGGAASGVGVAAAAERAQQAAVTAAQANVAKTKAALTLANTTLARDSALLAQGYIARSTVDSDRATQAQDAADVAAAEAAVAQAQAQADASGATVSQSGSTQQAQAAAVSASAASADAAAAMVRQDELNLEHTVITSPVDGTVVARDVSVGQTVAASLQTPTLFAIAQNLAKMQVDVNVGEPDIGNVKDGENVDFTVLAYPNRTFHGRVQQVRINPQTVNNVVTYDVVVLVDNKDGALLPGMTANASIDVATAKDALVVPLAALQWKPPFNHAHAGTHGATGGTAPASASASGSTGNASPWGATANGIGGGAAIAAGGRGSLFVRRDGTLARIPVAIALVTATQAAVTPAGDAALQPGDEVVVASSEGALRGGTRNGSPSSRPPMGGPMGGGAMRGIR